MPVVIAMLVAALAVEVLLGGGGTEGAWGGSFLSWLPGWLLGWGVAVVSAAVYALKPPPRRRTL